MSEVVSDVQYTDEWQEIVDWLLYQAYYRLLGVVEVLTDFDTLVNAAQWLAEHERGGDVSIVIPGRLAQWDGLRVAPPFDEPKMSVWLIGFRLYDSLPEKVQHRSLILRKGWWTLYVIPLPDVLGVATAVQTFRLPGEPAGGRAGTSIKYA